MQAEYDHEEASDVPQNAVKQSNPSLCKVCGGFKVAWYRIDAIGAGGNTLTSTLPPFTFKICSGHSEPIERHDGKLIPMTEPQEHNFTAYAYQLDTPSTSLVPLICISGGHTPYRVVEEPSVYLDPKQALSLLAWLKQKEEILEQLVREQENNATKP